MNYDCVNLGVAVVAVVIAIGSGAVCRLQKKRLSALQAQAEAFAIKQSEQDSAIEKLVDDQTEYQNKIKMSFDEFTLRTKAQMFLHEGNLLNENGEWVLENNGEKKIFKPAKIQATVSADKAEESVFKYTDSEVICTTTVKGQIKSELIFSIAGAPKAGKIFENGKVIKEFYYNELGQVIDK